MNAKPSNLKLPRVDFTSHLKEGYCQADNKLGYLVNVAYGLTETIKKSFGALGSKIMTVDRLSKLSVTGSSKKFFDDIESQSPETKILLDALRMQFEESGDACKFYLILTSEILYQMNTLINEGVTKIEVLDTFLTISKKIPKLCEELVVEKFDNLLNKEKILPLVQNVVRPNVVSDSEIIADLTYDACISAIYRGQNKSVTSDFSSEFVKVCKIMGGNLKDSFHVPGLFLDGKPEGFVTSTSTTKVAVYTCGFDYNRTEGTATVVFNSAQELADFTKNENEIVRKLVKGIHEAGVGVIICSGKTNQLLVDFANEFGIMVMNVSSKIMIRKIAATLDAKLNVIMRVPSQESLGTVDSVEFKEINEQEFVCLKRKDSPLSTIVLFGNTKQCISMAESGISSGVNLMKVLCRNSKLVAGTGAFEISLAKKIRELGNKLHKNDIKSYIYDAFANALEEVPKILIENSGETRLEETIAQVFKLHLEGKSNAGAVVMDDGSLEVFDDVTTKSVCDALYPKVWAITYAFGAIDQLTRVDHIIMAKAADFKPKQNTKWDEQDDF